ncbi:unnamed protein product [Cuscuta campestris]|uniref:Uncharacterized protein n=1 Tax=Cuscuta campestris TaxID=132261 RepID=A0A484L5H3_9ASTE|nr:unnamed protein product [Cuscuta campestris]
MMWMHRSPNMHSYSKFFKVSPTTSGVKCNFCNIKTRSPHSWKFRRRCFLVNSSKTTLFMVPARHPQPFSALEVTAALEGAHIAKIGAAAMADLGAAAAAVLAADLAEAMADAAGPQAAATATGAAVEVVAAVDICGNPQASIPGYSRLPPLVSLGLSPTRLIH